MPNLDLQSSLSLSCLSTVTSGQYTLPHFATSIDSALLPPECHRTQDQRAWNEAQQSCAFSKAAVQPALSFGVAPNGSGVPFHFHNDGFSEVYSSPHERRTNPNGSELYPDSPIKQVVLDIEWLSGCRSCTEPNAGSYTLTSRMIFRRTSLQSDGSPKYIRTYQNTKDHLNARSSQGIFYISLLDGGMQLSMLARRCLCLCSCEPVETNGLPDCDSCAVRGFHVYEASNNQGTA